MAVCSKCGVAKPIGEFYARSAQCKSCVRERSLAYRSSNLARVREYDRERAKLPHRRENAKKVLNEWRRKNPAKAARYRNANPEKRAAHVVLGNAVRSGQVHKPTHCQRCGVTPKRIEAHHWDYSKPLDVEWLCKPCHMKADQERRAA